MGFKRTAVVVAATISGVLTGLVAGAAPASAASEITIDSPNGTTVAHGAAIRVTGWNHSGSTESFYVDCSGFWDVFYVEPGQISVSIGSIDGPDSCEIRDNWSEDLLATFQVAGPVTTVSDARADRDAFYPLVRDGYLDKVQLSWRQDNDGRATVRIVDSSGRTVRTATPYAWQGRNSWTWNGENNRGRLVAKGRYRARITVNANTVTVPLSVKTGFVTKTFSVRREGNQGASFATSGSCYATRDSYDQIATLDCWGGRFAKATYRLRVPAGARDVRGTIDLNPTDLDRCCHGRITKGWNRPSKSSVVLWARVSGWRATDVNYVRVSYKRRVRI